MDRKQNAGTTNSPASQTPTPTQSEPLVQFYAAKTVSALPSAHSLFSDIPGNEFPAHQGTGKKFEKLAFAVGHLLHQFVPRQTTAAQLQKHMNACKDRKNDLTALGDNLVGLFKEAGVEEKLFGVALIHLGLKMGKRGGFSQNELRSLFQALHIQEPENTGYQAMATTLNDFGNKLNLAQKILGTLHTGLPPNIENDFTLAVLACSKKGDALEFAGGALRNDREVVLAAVRQDGQALKWASKRLRNDAEVLKAIGFASQRTWPQACKALYWGRFKNGGAAGYR